MLRLTEHSLRRPAISGGRRAAPRTLLALLLAAALLPVLGLGSAASAAPEAVRWLEGELSRLASDARIKPARAAVVVLDLASGRTLVDVNGAARFNVASNAKLITSAAALGALGPEYRFKTALYGAPAVDPKGRGKRTGVIGGDLYLKGFGDPMLDERDLWRMVRDLHDRGIRKIEGALIVDESYFDAQREAPLFDSKKTDAWYRPPVGALSLDSNVVRVSVGGAEAAGAPARVVLQPSSAHLVLDNRAMTVSSRRRNWIKVETQADGANTRVVVRGRVRVGYRGRPFRRRIEDPGLLAGHAFLGLLQRRGITLMHPNVRRGKVAPDARVLVEHYSAPLAVVLRSMNKRSDNFVAEQLLKVMGAEISGPPATSDKGLEAVQQHLESHGIKPGSYAFRNGSGLYEATSMNAHQIVQVLRSSYNSFRAGADFLSSLAIAGVDGTLRHRLVGTAGERYVRAKTGTLARAVTLSGYAGASTGRTPLAFAILLNDLPEGHVIEARAVADEMAAAIVNYLER